MPFLSVSLSNEETAEACIVIPIEVLAHVMPTLPILMPTSAYLPMDDDAYLSNCSSPACSAAMALLCGGCSQFFIPCITYGVDLLHGMMAYWEEADEEWAKEMDAAWIRSMIKLRLLSKAAHAELLAKLKRERATIEVWSAAALSMFSRRLSCGECLGANRMARVLAKNGVATMNDAFAEAPIISETDLVDSSSTLISTVLM